MVIFPKAGKVKKNIFSSHRVFRRKIDKLSTNQNVMDENTILNTYTIIHIGRGSLVFVALFL